MAFSTTIRASCWSFTINNPIDSDFQSLQKTRCPGFVKEIHYQEEIGENGTPHIQGCALTTQVRGSAMKDWLPRAHLEVARKKQALLDYVKKPETAVPGTQVVVQADYLAMDMALKEIAKYEMDWADWFKSATSDKRVKDKAFEKEEFWNAVKQILLERPQAVGLFTNPQLERAWINTRSVWIELLEKDRQTDRQSLENKISGESINEGELLADAPTCTSPSE